MNTIQAFYTILWDQANAARARLLLDVLPGIRNPQAFIEIDEGRTMTNNNTTSLQYTPLTAGQVCTQTQKAPLIRPKVTHGDKTISVLVAHSSAVSHRRKEIANFLAIEAQRLKSNMTVIELNSRMEKYGLQWLEATIGAVAKDIKFYRMTFL